MPSPSTAARSSLIPFVLAPAWGLNWSAVKIVLGSVPPFLLRAVGLGGDALLQTMSASFAWAPGTIATKRWPSVPAGRHGHREGFGGG